MQKSSKTEEGGRKKTQQRGTFLELWFVLKKKKKRNHEL